MKSESLDSVKQDELKDESKDDLLEDICCQDDKVDNNLPLYNFDQLPAYLKDNQYILTGYRANYSMKQVWKSLFTIHNETGNIWSHAISFLVFIGLSIFTGTIQWHPLQSSLDTIIMTVFTISASYTFLSSSLFHLHICHSQKLYSIFVCLDFTGISALIAASSITIVYLLFYCHSTERIVWSSLIVVFNLVGVIGPLFPGFLGPRYRTARAILFILSSVLIVLPVIHFVAMHGNGGFPDLNTNFAGIGFLLMILFYVLGVCIYIFKIPERFYPGKYDLIFHSHQIWHILVLLGAISHYTAVTSLLSWTLSHATCLNTA